MIAAWGSRAAASMSRCCAVIAATLKTAGFPRQCCFLVATIAAVAANIAALRLEVNNTVAPIEGSVNLEPERSVSIELDVNGVMRAVTVPVGLLKNTTVASEVLETQLSTLSDDPSAWVGEGCTSARCAATVVLAELRRRARSRPTLRYLRVSKTASCVLFEALGDARRRDPATCGLELWLSGHHEVTRNDVPQNDPVFVTLRDPCERLASLYDHLRRLSPPGHAIHSFGDDAAAWGNHVLSSGESIEAWGTPGLTRPQSDYVSGRGGADAEIACLPTLRRDVERILAVHAPGCRLGELDSDNPACDRQREPPPRPAATICDAAAKIYPGDTLLWRRHCAPVGL